MCGNMLKSSSLTKLVCILPRDKPGKPMKYTHTLALLVSEQDAQAITIPWLDHYAAKKDPVKYCQHSRELTAA